MENRRQIVIGPKSRFSLRKWPTDPTTSKRMRSVRQSATGPELRVGSILRELGFRFRANVRSLPGKPDFCHKSDRWVILVHGCFWHSHCGCGRATVPSRNRRAWLQKVRGNQERDRKVMKELRGLGYAILTVWECETKDRIRLSRRLIRFVTRHTSLLRGTNVTSR